MKATGILQKSPLEEEVRRVIAQQIGLIDLAIKVDKLSHKKASEEMIRDIRSIQASLDTLTRAVRRKQWDIDKAAEDAGKANSEGEAIHNEVNY